MEVTASIQTQPGGDDEESKKRKKAIAFVAILFIVLSITAWFFIQPLLVGEKTATVTPIAKNPAKKKAASGDASTEVPPTDTTGNAPTSTGPVDGADNASTSANVPTAEVSLDTTTDVAGVVNGAATVPEPATVPAPEPSVAANPVSDVIAPAPAIGPPAPIEPPPPGPAGEAVTTTDEPTDTSPERWEKVRAENPGAVLPSNDMWVFQTRKLKAKVYVVKHAESLKAISAKLLYSDRFWVKIWSLNPGVVDPEAVPIGTEIILDPSARGTASD